jgi:hypothetical protein
MAQCPLVVGVLLAPMMLSWHGLTISASQLVAWTFCCSIAFVLGCFWDLRVQGV